jgi:glycosyltransferase involved in cell wall biosynthesis
LTDTKEQSQPFVSIIIPTLNEEKYIRKCLESLACQTYPKSKFEVLIVDGASSDNTLSIVSSFAGTIDLRILENRKIKHVFALNQGIRKTKGNYFVVIGGHSFVEKDFLEKSVEAFFEVREGVPNLAAVGGSIKVIYENRFARLVSSLFASPFSGASDFWYSKRPHSAKTVVFGFYNKEIIEKVGCFDEDMIKGQDFEINLRLRKKGYTLYYCPEIKSCYHARNNFPGFVKQTFDNGAAKGLCIRKGHFSPLWFVPLVFVFYQLLLLSAGFFLQISWVFIGLLVPFITYWVISVLVSIQTSKKKRENVALPFMFWLLHTITGIGFLAGLSFGKKSVKH